MSKLPHAGAKKNRVRLANRKDKQYQAIMTEAFRRLDSDDYAGFWDGIEDLNVFIAGERDE